MRWARAGTSSVGRAATVVLASLVAVALPALARPAAGQATQPSAAPDFSSPKGALRTFAMAEINGDGKTIRDALLTTNPTESRMADASANLAVAITDLSHAMTAKFGPGPTQQLMGDPAEVLKANLEMLDKATETIHGDTATVVSSPDEPGPPPVAGAMPATAPSNEGPQQNAMTLRKVDGQWKVSVSGLAKGNTDQHVQETLASVDTAVAGYRSVLADLNAGKLPTVDAVGAALSAKMTGGGAMPPGAPPAAPVAPGQ